MSQPAGAHLGPSRNRVDSADKTLVRVMDCVKCVIVLGVGHAADGLGCWMISPDSVERAGREGMISQSMCRDDGGGEQEEQI